MPGKCLDEPGNFNRTCGFMGLCRQRHKPGHPAGEIEGSWAIDKESGEKTAAPSTNGGSSNGGSSNGGSSNGSNNGGSSSSSSSNNGGSGHSGYIWATPPFLCGAAGGPRAPVGGLLGPGAACPGENSPPFL